MPGQPTAARKKSWRQEAEAEEPANPIKKGNKHGRAHSKNEKGEKRMLGDALLAAPRVANGDSIAEGGGGLGAQVPQEKTKNGTS